MTDLQIQSETEISLEGLEATLAKIEQTLTGASTITQDVWVAQTARLEAIYAYFSDRGYETQAQRAQEVFSLGQLLVDQNTLLIESSKKAMQVASTVKQERDAVVEKYDELTTAIEYGDDDHELLMGFADEIRNATFDIVSSDMDDVLATNLAQIIGTTYDKARRFVGVLAGDYAIRPNEIFILKGCVDMMAKDSIEEWANRRIGYGSMSQSHLADGYDSDEEEAIDGFDDNGGDSDEEEVG